MKNIKNRIIKFLSLIIMLYTFQYSTAQAVGTPYIVPTDQMIPFSFLAGGITKLSGSSDGQHNTNDVQQTNDGGYITIGNTNASSSGDMTATNHNDNDDVWVIKYDTNGKREWQRLYGGVGYDHGNAIIQTLDGGYIFIATINNNGLSPGTGDVMSYPLGHAGGEIWVVKLDTTGNIEWQRLYGGNNLEEGRTITQLSDGSYIIGGFTESSLSGDVTGSRTNFDFWVLKLTSAGAITWQQTYNNPGSGSGDDYLDSLTPTLDGTGYILGGRSISNYRSTNGQDYFVLKISLTGEVQWQKLYGSSGTDVCFSIISTSDGGYMLAGRSNGSLTGDLTLTNHGSYDMWIIKLNALGNIDWQRLLGGNLNDEAHSVIETSDGGYIVAGASSSSENGNITAVNKGQSDVCIFKLNTAGNIEWQKLYGGIYNEGINTSLIFTKGSELNPTEIKRTNDGGYIILSLSRSDNSGDVTDFKPSPTTSPSLNYWLFKIDESGNIVEVPDVGQRD